MTRSPTRSLRNADWQAGALHAKQYLIIDRDTKYSEQFRRLIRDNGTKVIRLPPMSPNLNAYADRVSVRRTHIALFAAQTMRVDTVALRGWVASDTVGVPPDPSHDS